MRRILVFCLFLSGMSLRADSVDTIPFRAVLRAANETTPVADAGATGSVTVWLHVIRDANGVVTSGSLDFSVNYKFTVAPVTVTAMHIHKAAAGVAGGIVIPVPLTSFTDATGIGSIPTKQVQFSSADTATTVIDAVKAILADPSGYYFNIHTTDSPGGAMRGQLVQADMAVLIGQMSPLNETPTPIQNSTASAVGSVIALRTRDKNLALTSGLVIFDVTYTGFPADTHYSGLHLHFGAAGATGPVTIDSTLKPPPPDGSAGNMHYEVEVDLARNLAPETLNALFDNPSAAYINVHTTVSPGGAARAQLRRTDHTVIQVSATPQEEVATTPVSITASAPSAVHLYTIRNADGSVANGVVIFDENPRFPAGTTFTATHIHDQVAGQNGPVTIDSKLTGTPLLVADGVGNIFRAVTVTAAGALSSLNDLMTNPEKHYLNLHTSQFPGGAVRAQLSSSKPSPTVSLMRVAATDDTRVISASGSLMTVFGTNMSQLPGTLDGYPSTLSTVPTTLNGTSMTIGGFAAPVITVAPDHLTIQVPTELTPGGYNAVVTGTNGTSNTFVVNVQAIYPSIFFDTVGGVVTKLPSQSLIRPDNGAAAGDVLIIYMTGLGQTSPPLGTGKLAARDPLSFTATPIVTIGAKSANVLHSLAVPGFAGLYQIAVTMPTGVAPGNAALQVTLSGNASNIVNLTAR